MARLKIREMSPSATSGLFEGLRHANIMVTSSTTVTKHARSVKRTEVMLLAAECCTHSWEHGSDGSTEQE
eukprot:6190019-Pleurochrysis_carterae.AAC.1